MVDFSGAGYAAPLTEALRNPTDRTLRPAVIVAAPGAPYPSAEAASQALRPYLAGETRTPAGARLDDAVIVGGTAADPSLDLWTRNIVEPALKTELTDALAGAVRRARLEASGLSADRIAAIDAYRPQVAQFSPKSAAGRVSASDNLPAFVGLAMGFVLYALTLTGAGILLNSVIEEKSNRILEVLLTVRLGAGDHRRQDPGRRGGDRLGADGLGDGGRVRLLRPRPAAVGRHRSAC